MPHATDAPTRTVGGAFSEYEVQDRRTRATIEELTGERLAALAEEVGGLRAYIDKLVEQRMGQLAAAVVPTLTAPSDTVYEIRGYDGVWRQADSVQKALELWGSGRDMQLRMVWPGVR